MALPRYNQTITSEDTHLYDELGKWFGERLQQTGFCTTAVLGQDLYQLRREVVKITCGGKIQMSRSIADTPHYNNYRGSEGCR